MPVEHSGAPFEQPQLAMILGLTYNLRSDVEAQPGDPDDRLEELDSEETIAALEAALGTLGHRTVRLGWGRAMLGRIEELQREGTVLDGVFNLAEGIGGRGRESQVPAVLEMLGIPCSGSDPLAIAITLDKAMAKRLVRSHGIATAPFIVVRTAVDLTDHTLRFPCFAKPAAEGSSMGITEGSFCRDQDELARTVERLLEQYGQAVLVEEFLSGDEFTVGIVGNGASARAIGTMQIIPKQAGGAFIYSVDVKRDFRNQVDYLFPPAISSELAGRVAKVALRVYEALECRDVARVDIRCDRDGEPNFIEVNPLPGINPSTSDLVILARGMGWSYEELIGTIVESAAERWKSGS